MDGDRLDALLDAALATGAVPDDATAEERDAILAMLGRASALRAAGAVIENEATESMPVARARFERFLAADQRALTAPRATSRNERRGALARFFGRGPFVTVAWSTAAVALLAVGGLAARALLFTSAETVQAFEPGDYVELAGVVADVPGAEGAGTGSFTVASEFNDVQVDISADTAVTNADGAAEALGIRQGTAVTVAGVVDTRGRVAARSVMVSPAGGPAPQRTTFKQLREVRPELDGTIVTFALSADGQRGRVLLTSATGERLLVNVDGKSLERLLSLTSGLGARVSVGQEPGQSRDEFSLSGVEPPAPAVTPSPAPSGTTTPAARRTPPADSRATPALASAARLAGIVTNREANVLTVETKAGPRLVVVTRETRILVGESGLLRERILDGSGAIVGHGVAVTGVVEKGTGRLRADVLIAGAKGAE